LDQSQAQVGVLDEGEVGLDERHEAAGRPLTSSAEARKT